MMQASTLRQHLSGNDLQHWPTLGPEKRFIFMKIKELNVGGAWVAQDSFFLIKTFDKTLFKSLKIRNNINHQFVGRWLGKLR